MSRYRRWRLLKWEQRAAAAGEALKAYRSYDSGYTNLTLLNDYAKAVGKRTLWRLRNGLGSGG